MSLAMGFCVYEVRAMGDVKYEINCRSENGFMGEYVKIMPDGTRIVVEACNASTMNQAKAIEFVEQAHADGFPRRVYPPNPSLPTVDQLARALFETNKRIVEFVRHVAESENMPLSQLVERRRTAMQTAWQRNEFRARSDAEAQAHHLLVALKAGESK